MIQASIYGRLGGDPVYRETRNGNAMATASLAVNVAQASADEDTAWFSLSAFGKTGEALLRHHKGDLLAAMGPLTRRSYTDRSGVDREGWSLTCEQIVSARTVRPGGTRKPKDTTDDQRPAADSTLDDDIPF